MAQPYVGEIRMFGGNFPPVGWMFCDGQQLPISENETLFQLIGTTYGGDGESTFALPDLRGRLPIHQGNGFILADYPDAEHNRIDPYFIALATRLTETLAAVGMPRCQGNVMATNLRAVPRALEAKQRQRKLTGSNGPTAVAPPAPTGGIAGRSHAVRPDPWHRH